MTTTIHVPLCEHVKSGFHISAEKFEEESDCMSKSLERMCEEEEEMTIRTFRNGVLLGKNDRPFDDYQGLLELQKVNGTKIAAGLRSLYSAKKSYCM